jgi:phosphate acyltransferase
MVKLVIDMMGSDLGSSMSKKAVSDFHASHPDCTLILVGKKEELADMASYQIIDAQDVVAMETGALEVLRKKDSSMVKAVQAVLDLKADGVVSAGSTGAFLSASTLMLKKIPGVIRPALVVSFPNLGKGGFCSILDVGASNANTPEEMAQFAVMGSLYESIVNGVSNPSVKLLSNGSEEGKGSPEGKAAYELLKGSKKVNFQGNIEGNKILSGEADVIVTDGYSGNVLLKSTEGAAKAMGGLLKQAFKRNFASKIGYLLTKKGLGPMKNSLDPKKTGGSLLLGVNGVVVKAHGNSDAEAFMHAIEVAYRLSTAQIVSKIAEGLKE